jgi:hypothetical protein
VSNHDPYSDFRFSMLVCGVLSSEKRPSDARCGTYLLLDKKSLLSSQCPSSR